ncbi:hypothetical protein JZ751_021187 [Albula glossodonta]|uniref:Uncharacterized protein n=1 Tax=Albula glossodonta TaxID=121402 RepID=A0A8T2NNH8_9TELE|nr:hypothetical protein JZ751_021187 [Albula glossodonta]
MGNLLNSETVSGVWHLTAPSLPSPTLSPHPSLMVVPGPSELCPLLLAELGPSSTSSRGPSMASACCREPRPFHVENGSCCQGYAGRGL